MSSPESISAVPDYFTEVLKRADELDRRYGDAVARHQSTSNPVLRVFTGVSVRRWAAALDETQTEAAAALQKAQLQTGEMPMFED